MAPVELIVVLAVILLLISLNAIFVLSEFATIAARRSRIEEMAEAGSTSARLLLPIVEHPVRLDNYVAACQLGITLSSLILGFYGERTLGTWLSGGLVSAGGMDAALAATAATLVVLSSLTVIQIVFGETVPKAIAMRFPERLAVAVTWPMTATIRVMQPAISLFNGTAMLILRLLGVKRSVSHNRVYSPEEIQLLASESHEAGKLGALERQMLHNAMILSDLKARMVMIPRNRLVVADAATPVPELLEIVTRSPFSRVPVYEESPDHLIGLVHLKDLFRLDLDGASDATSIIRPVPVLSENAPVHQVWAELSRRRHYMAVIIDEYGGTAGIITQEDLLEEIIGEVQDEFDDETAPIVVPAGGGLPLVRGDVIVADVNARLDVELPLDRADTIGGLVMDELGRIANVGDEVTVSDLRLRVTQVRDNWVAQVALIRPRPTPAGEQPGVARS